jgi:hypothetical protein
MGELERRLGGAVPAPARPAAEEASEDSPPSLPTEAEEAAFLAEDRRDAGSPVAPPPVETAAAVGLPPLDDLVRRIPADVRAALDELFRARFTTVKRATEGELRPQTS